MLRSLAVALITIPVLVNLPPGVDRKDPAGAPTAPAVPHAAPLRLAPPRALPASRLTTPVRHASCAAHRALAAAVR